MKRVFYILLLICYLCVGKTYAIPHAVDSLCKEVFTFNNLFQYDSSIKILNNYLSKPNITSEEKFYCTIYKSYTYKRLYDYATTLKYLDEAYEIAVQMEQKDEFINHVLAEKAYAYFDIHEYKKADSAMQILYAQHYQYLDTISISRIMMQRAYLSYLNKNYLQSEKEYDDAIGLMLKSSPCDLPMILGKKIELYGAMKDEKKMIATFNQSLHYADSFKIFKYTMYSYECMLNGYKNKRDLDNSFLFFHKLDSLQEQYAEQEHLKNIDDLEKKYETEKKEKKIIEQNVLIEKAKFKITALVSTLGGIILASLLFFIYKKRKEAQAETILQQKFTDELLQNTEDERKRIATDLHDGVNHELLTLKNKANTGKPIEALELEKIIHEIRQVSRDLYPAMFESIGLVASIEALCERMTAYGLFTTCEINYKLKLSKRNELQLYRIIQEALNNTLKHAKANAAKVTINTVENELQVEIKDNGIGFDADDKMKNASSFGIQSVMQRARAIGGKSIFESNEKGTTLILKTPIH